ncbi:uncharacterized protein LOC126802398 [Argentina anserina]|uniref:uncharacterized protein LOC126802398 n=1 Tax=Argentina anserina TaxID=57926 RepID=UPI0021768D79|nr:uncharacterized protein LOC126802398 [Potentilla anserina]
MTKLRLVSQEHSQLPPKSFRLSPGLRANAALSFLGLGVYFRISFIFYTVAAMMTILRLVSQEHSQWPPKSFRLSPGLRASAALSFLGCLTLIFFVHDNWRPDCSIFHKWVLEMHHVEKQGFSSVKKKERERQGSGIKARPFWIENSKMDISLAVGKYWRRSTAVAPLALLQPRRTFRSDSALEALSKASDENLPNLVLYNYPSFSGAFSALFAHLFHSCLHLPCLSLPFSSLHPFSVDDLCIQGLQRCYLLDFLGPRGLAAELSRRAQCEVIAFDHRKSVVKVLPSGEDFPENVVFRVDTGKSSSSAVYDYFSANLAEIGCDNGMGGGLLEVEERERVEMVLKYIEDGDLRRWSLPEIREFNIGVGEWRSKLNCLTNPYMYEQLLEMSATDVIAKGKSYVSSRQKVANKLLDKALKIRLGRGFYGECLGVRADGNAELSDEIGKQLSVKSVAAGLRPIGAVIFMHRRNLKMCLRSMDTATDTSEVAKAYGGGGTPSSSSFIIRMDEYNQWILGNST